MGYIIKKYKDNKNIFISDRSIKCIEYISENGVLKVCVTLYNGEEYHVLRDNINYIQYFNKDDKDEYCSYLFQPINLALFPDYEEIEK